MQIQCFKNIDYVIIRFYVTLVYATDFGICYRLRHMLQTLVYAIQTLVYAIDFGICYCRFYVKIIAYRKELVQVCLLDRSALTSNNKFLLYHAIILPRVIRPTQSSMFTILMDRSGFTVFSC